MSENNVTIGRDVTIHPTARLLAKELVIGDFTKIGENVIINGNHVEIGKEAWITTNVLIGGGRSELGSLKTGDFLHLGRNSMVNTANEVTIGDEVGIGMDSKVFTHGAYPSEYDGFPYQEGPVHIGTNVWMPYGIINPNVTIGDNVVIASMSLVNRDLPAGCLAGGIPVKILRENFYPQKITSDEKIKVVDKIIEEANRYDIKLEKNDTATVVNLGNTIFDLPKRKIEGPASKEADRIKDLLRRHGIRFRYYSDGEAFRAWD